MRIVYWAHSYRPEDARINKHFGNLIEAAGFIVNFDPPSPDVNQSKLEHNLRSCDGMVAVLTWRPTGPSPYILYEIGLSLRARKPIAVFLDDRLAGNIVPPRVLQRRFSHRTYFRQVREHNHALHELKTYIGEQPGPRYQPSLEQRVCGFLGLASLSRATRQRLLTCTHERGYRGVDLERIPWDNPLIFDAFEQIACLDLTILCADARGIRTRQWAGALHAVAVPCISFTTDHDFPFSDGFPRQFQPRLTETDGAPPIAEVVNGELNLYEQEFLETQDPQAIERYTRMQLDSGYPGGRYEETTRNLFTEVIMGDQYNVSGQAGAVGKRAHAHDMTFTQAWEQFQDKPDLGKLADQLEKLRGAMESQASDPEHRLAVGAVAAAEQSARTANGPKVLEYLKLAGEWAYRVAEKIGVELAARTIMAALGK